MFFLQCEKVVDSEPKHDRTRVSSLSVNKSAIFHTVWHTSMKKEAPLLCDAAGVADSDTSESVGK